MKRYYLVQEDKDSNGRHYAYSVGISYEGECKPPERTYYFSQDAFLKEKWFDSLEKAREYAQKVDNGVIAASDMPKLGAVQDASKKTAVSRSAKSLFI